MAPLAIEVAGLVKRFGDVTAVDGLDLRIQQGECVAILGPNGAGKTTTLEILEGLQQPTSGEVRVLGRGWKDSGDWLRSRIGIQLQEARLRDKLRVEEVLRLFRSFYPSGMDLEEALRTTDLVELRRKFIHELSGGQRQRVALAVALLGNPDIIFLDEPSTGLDPRARHQLWDFIDTLKSRGRTLLLTTHYMEEARRLADRIIIIDRGRIIAEGTADTLTRSLEAHTVVALSTEPPLSAEALKAVAGVLDVRGSAEEPVLSLKDFDTTLPSLLKLAAQSGARIHRLSSREPTLDDVFLRLTGRSLVEPREEAK
jgi:ABC-2 type transport system ATP-binding protein